MKKLILSILATLLFSISAYTQCFSPVSSGRIFQSMNIYVSHASMSGNNLQPGDEVGVFDGEKCVGVGVLIKELTGAPIYLEVEVSRQFLWWDGFTPGNTISYRFCSRGEPANRIVTPTYISNGPTFVSNDSCVVELRTVNNAPHITSVPVTEARPGHAYSYTITAEDIDGDTLTYTAVVLPGWLVFNASTHTLAATPGEGDIGDQHVTIRVSDGSLYTDHTFVVTVNYGNHAPTFISDPQTSAFLGDAYEYTMRAQDIDSDSLHYSAPQLPDWLSFFPETNVISGIPANGDLGRHDVVLRVSDGTVSADQSFTIIVENVNNPPRFTSTPINSALKGELYLYTAGAEDLDDDDLAFSAPILPDWLSFDINTRVLYGIPDDTEEGDNNITLEVSDGKAEAYQNFVITIEAQSGVGLDDYSSPDLMEVYPNPSDGRFFVKLSKEFEKEIILEILNPMGKVLLQKEFPPYFLVSKSFKLKDQPGGIYFIRVYNSSFHSVGKMIIR
ncbi:MAG: putative Ig domain-containing protein [Bacteroidota bacterium]